MRLFLFLLLTLAPIAAPAAWIVKSEFQLHLNEGLFDKLIEDFWQSLQGRQEIQIGSFTVTPGGIPIQIQGVSAEVNYSFPLPQRVNDRTREWELNTKNLSAKLRVNKISASQVIVREVDGTIFTIRVHAECNNVVLALPLGSTEVSARVRAELKDNQVKLSMPEYNANWGANSWHVESMNCVGVEGFDQVVRNEALQALSSFRNFDGEVRTAITENFARWSHDASLLLLSGQELPTGKDYLKITYEPRSAEDSQNGLLLAGEMKFEYPFVAPDQIIEHSFALKNPPATKDASPQLLLPFAAIRSMMMGEYLAGKLEYSVYSNEIPAFTELMKSRFQQLMAWPELQRYPEDTKFIFQFLPIGPPSIQKEKTAANSVSAELNLPLAVRMFAPLSGQYRPMVEFRTFLAGQSSLKLLKDGKIELKLAATKHPLTYKWAESYVANQKPNQRIAADKLADKIRSALNAEGFTMKIPPITVGRDLQLLPGGWNLEGGNIRLNFDAK